jgi:anaerobic dimethyl sulfoxide reductase subunit B (iron-sulfur subunit)
MAQNGFYIDMTKCSACKTCVIACKDVNDLTVGYNYRHVDELEGGTFPAMWASSISLACNHCATPACMAVCPVGAIVKEADTGLVVIDTETCTGCQSCVTACPYQVPVYFPDKNKADKCHGCRGLLAEGEKPACVAACSTRCLDFGDLDELRAKYSGQDLTNALTVLPDPSMTMPSLLVNPKTQVKA